MTDYSVGTRLEFGIIQLARKIFVLISILKVDSNIFDYWFYILF